VLAVGPCFTHNEYGQSRNSALTQSGRGHLVTVPDPVTAHAYRDILDRLLDQAGAARPVRIEGTQGQPIWGVNLRAVEDKGKLLVHLLNLSREPHQVRLLMKPAPKHALNLITGKQVEFPLTLSPLEPTLLTLDPEPR
jgi:hypothetical protein